MNKDPASWRAGRDTKPLDWPAVPAVRTKQRERIPADPYAARKGNSLIQCDHRASPRWAKCVSRCPSNLRRWTNRQGRRATGKVKELRPISTAKAMRSREEAKRE
jgi:hypothetical protein